MREIGLPTSNEKKCPKCAELIRKDVQVCRFCGNDNFVGEKIKVSKNIHFKPQIINKEQYDFYILKGKCCYCGSESIKNAEILGKEEYACFNCFKYFEQK